VCGGSVEVRASLGEKAYEVRFTVPLGSCGEVCHTLGILSHWLWEDVEATGFDKNSFARAIGSGLYALALLCYVTCGGYSAAGALEEVRGMCREGLAPEGLCGDLEGILRQLKEAEDRLLQQYDLTEVERYVLRSALQRRFFDTTLLRLQAEGLT